MIPFFFSRPEFRNERYGVDKELGPIRSPPPLFIVFSCDIPVRRRELEDADGQCSKRLFCI